MQNTTVRNATTLPISKPKTLNIGLWIAQVILGVLFIYAGTLKASQPISQLSQMLPWASHTPVALVRFIGVAEIFGGVGLILPSLLRIKPSLTPWAATGLATVMLLALGFHVLRGEYSVIGVNLMITAIAGFIAWGRFKKVPIMPKY